MKNYGHFFDGTQSISEALEKTSRSIITDKLTVFLNKHHSPNDKSPLNLETTGIIFFGFDKQQEKLEQM